MSNELKLELKTIAILQTYDGVTYLPTDIEAQVFGTIAVHRSISHPVAWTVTESESGTWIADFKAEHVAINFAKRIASMVDWTGIATRIRAKTMTTQERGAIKQIAAMRWHECFLNHPRFPAKQPSEDIPW